MTAHVLRGDARHLPLPDASVDLVITSPPYFGLRSYTDNGEHYAGQIGSESTPQEWLEALWACTAEWVRVLKPDGNLFVNLGDKYATSASGKLGASGSKTAYVRDGYRDTSKFAREKSLLGLPWRYALGCTDQLGLILRAEIIWAKPNGLPESVTDRVRRAHEQVFHFTRQPRYYAAVDEIREPTVRRERPWELENRWPDRPRAARAAGGAMEPDRTLAFNPLGKLPGSVWDIPSSPLQVPERVGVDHFAAFPPALVRPIVLGWSPPGVCTACGHGRRPVVDAAFDTQGRTTNGPKNGERRSAGALNMASNVRSVRSTTITGYACACPRLDAPTRPAVVLDPFGGTGTTALVASTYGRVGVTVDLSADYCRLAHWRVNDPGERARARAMPKPPPIPDGMEPLFTM